MTMIGRFSEKNGEIMRKFVLISTNNVFIYVFLSCLNKRKRSWRWCMMKPLICTLMSLIRWFKTKRRRKDANFRRWCFTFQHKQQQKIWRKCGSFVDRLSQFVEFFNIFKKSTHFFKLQTKNHVPSFIRIASSAELKVVNTRNVRWSVQILNWNFNYNSFSLFSVFLQFEKYFLYILNWN